MGKSRIGNKTQSELWALVCTTPLLPTSKEPERGVQPCFHSNDRPAICSSCCQMPSRRSSRSGALYQLIRTGGSGQRAGKSNRRICWLGKVSIWAPVVFILHMMRYRYDSDDKKLLDRSHQPTIAHEPRPKHP